MLDFKLLFFGCVYHNGFVLLSNIIMLCNKITKNYVVDL